MSNLISRQLFIDDQTIHYQLERKSVKNLNLRIRNDGSVYVSADDLVPIEEIDSFVRSKSSFITNAIKRFNELAEYKPQPKKYVSGETFYIQGRSLRLQVSQAKKDSISSDGINIYLEVKNPEDTERTGTDGKNGDYRHAQLPVRGHRGRRHPPQKRKNQKLRRAGCAPVRGRG